jgi:UDP-N-acetylmuramoylalanine--D-glutamate ligase
MFKHKKIFVLGMARSGYEAAKLLIKMNNEVVLNDLKKEQDQDHIKELSDLGVKVILGEHPDDLFNQTFDYLIKNPGIPNNHKYVEKAIEHDIFVINEMELAYQLFPKDITIIGVTGSNGKTTTATLIYEILKRTKFNVHLMGNIGYPACAYVDKVKSNDIIVMEVSIQQLCNFNQFKVDIAVLTNLYEAHLDFVGNYNNYLNIKKRIFKHQEASDYAVLNIDNLDVVKITNDIKAEKVYFSSKKNNINGCSIKDKTIYYWQEPIISLSEIKLKGNHNYENIMAALLVAKKLGVSNKIIKEVLTIFGGVEHRIEYVTSKQGIQFYNDSKSTNIKATQIALSSFQEPIILLLGGLDRKHSFNDLSNYLNHVKYIIGYGETKERIKDYSNSVNIKCEIVETLEMATNKAYELATKGDIILLSPACASWDQFSDFEERGRMFKQYIANLI